MVAWRHALIPEDDPVPWSAVEWISLKHEYGPIYGEEGDFQTERWNAALSTIETEYDLCPGRDWLGGLAAQRRGEALAEDEDDLDEAASQLLD